MKPIKKTKNSFCKMVLIMINDSEMKLNIITRVAFEENIFKIYLPMIRNYY